MWNVELLEVTDPSLAYIVLGGFVVAFSMISLLVKEKLYMNEVVLGTAFGILMGPHCANIFDPRSWATDTSQITLEVMRIVLATGLFAIGVELPQSYMADHAKGLLVMVVPTMAFGWLVVAAVIYVLFPPLNYISSLVIAACLTPTDPIICAAIVGGKFAIKHVPTNLRRILAAESAANDGLAYPFLSISLYLTLETSTGAAFAKWFVIGWLYQVFLGIILGAVMGLGFAQLMKFSYRKGFIDRESYVAQYLALALFTIGVVSTLGSDDLLAAFAAGSAISWDGHFNVQIENEVFSSVIDLVLNCGCFVYIGAWLPFDAFRMETVGILPWRLGVLFVAVLFLRRIPAMLLLHHWVPEISGWKEALFSGHFGPMGVGAVFVSTLAVRRLPAPESPPANQQQILAASLQPIVAFVVLCSIFIHGLSIPFFSFGRRIGTRTISISRTFTSRNAAGAVIPEWLVGIRRAPEMSVTSAGTVGVADLEGGAGAPQHDHDTAKDDGNGKDTVQVPLPVPPAVHYADDADAPVVSRAEAAREGAGAPLGVAGMLEDVSAPLATASLRRRYASAADTSVTPPSDTHVAPAYHAHVHAHAHTHGRVPIDGTPAPGLRAIDAGADGTDSGAGAAGADADLAARVAARLQERREEHIGDGEAGARTPTKLVRFPSSVAGSESEAGGQ